MDGGIVPVGNEGSASVLLRKNLSTDSADACGNGACGIPACSSADTVPAGCDLHLHDLYGAFLQIESIKLIWKSGENNEFKA